MEENKENKETPEDNILEEVEADFSDKPQILGTKIRGMFNTEVKDLGDGVMEAIISSEIIDRHGEAIDMKGMDIKQYMQNPIIANAHNYDLPSVGRTLKLTKTRDGKLISKFEWAKDFSEKAKELYDLYKNKFQFAFSIGFIPETMDKNVYTKSTMIEFSPVLVPANPEALLLAKKKGIDTDFLKGYTLEEVKKDLIKEPEETPAEETPAEVPAVETPAEEKPAEEAPEVPAEPVVEALTKKVDALEKMVDPVVMKKINGQFNNNKEDGEVSKEMKFLLFAKGLQTGDMSAYRAATKDAMNTTDQSDVLPPAEFIQEIERLEEQVGVAARYANVRRSAVGAGLSYVLGDDDLQIYDTAESGVKKSTQLTYKPLLLAWRKFAGILPITDELTEDAAFDLWADATNRFARAFARKGDELVFTNKATGGNTKDGLINVSGTAVVNPTGNDVADITADDLYKMIYSVPSMSAANGRFWLNRTILGQLALLKDKNDRPLWQGSIAEGVPSLIAGKPYTEVEVMPGLDDDSTEKAFIVFGDLKYVTLGERTGLNIKIFDTGNVGDPDEDEGYQDGSEINLLTQDVQAMRAVKRMNAVVRFPAAFSVLKTVGFS